MSTKMVYMCGLNAAEIVMEVLGKELWKKAWFRNFLLGNLSQLNLRRLTAFSYPFCNIWFGIFAQMYFFGDSSGETGHVYMRRFMNPFTLTYWYMHVIWGYSFAQCCIEVEKRVGFPGEKGKQEMKKV